MKLGHKVKVHTNLTKVTHRKNRQTADCSILIDQLMYFIHSFLIHQYEQRFPCSLFQTSFRGLTVSSLTIFSTAYWGIINTQKKEFSLSLWSWVQLILDPSSRQQTESRCFGCQRGLWLKTHDGAFQSVLQPRLGCCSFIFPKMKNGFESFWLRG